MGDYKRSLRDLQESIEHCRGVKMREITEKEFMENEKFGEPWMERCCNCNLPLETEEEIHSGICNDCECDDDKKFNRYIEEECTSYAESDI